MEAAADSRLPEGFSYAMAPNIQSKLTSNAESLDMLKGFAR